MDYIYDIFLLFGIVILVFIFFSYGSLFDITTVSVSAPKDYDPKRKIELNLELSSFLRGKNYFYIGKTKVKNFLKKKFFEIDNISFSKDLQSHSSHISISTYPKKYSVCKKEREKCFFVTDKGFVFDRSSASSTPDFLHIIDKRNITLKEGKFIEKNDVLREVFATNSVLKEKDIGIKEAIIKGESSFEFVTKKGWKIIFAYKEGYPLEDQLQELFSFLKNEDIELNNDLSYIDLTQEGRVYYK